MLQSGHTSDQTAIRSPDLPFNGLYPRTPCNYMVHYPFTDPGGIEGELAWLVDHSGHFTHEVVTCQP